MIATTDIIRYKFTEYNSLYFDNSIKTPSFGVIHTYKDVGTMTTEVPKYLMDTIRNAFNRLTLLEKMDKSDAATAIGKAMMENNFDLKVSRVIRMSDYFDLTEEQFRDALVHEMAHCLLMEDMTIVMKHLLVDKESFSNGHGEDFMKLAKKLNDEHGMNIQVKIKLSELKRRKGAPIFNYFKYVLFG